MPRRKEPLAVLEAKGRVHTSKAELEQRRAAEVKAPAPKTAKPPKWLPEDLKKDFRALGKALIALGIYCDLDRDTLGRYLVAQHQYQLATEQAEEALEKRDLEDADAWGRVQERYVKQARNHAADLGLNITARCRLVLPDALKDKADAEEEKFLALLEGRRRA